MFQNTHEMGLFVRDTGADRRHGTVLIIHGLGDSGISWAPLLETPALSLWRFVLPDLPGYGKSLWPKAPLSLADHGDYLMRFLTETGRDHRPVVLLGHSMGGVVSLLIAERYPELVSGLINVEGNISLQDCTFSGKAEAYSRTDFLSGGFSKLRTDVYAAGTTQPALAGYYAGLRMCDPVMFHENSRELVSVSAAETAAKRWAALPAATLYLAGVPGGIGPRSRELLDKAGVFWQKIEPAGHWPNIDQPDDFTGRVAEFLETVS